MRLNKFLAQCGIASRRKADELIKQQRVFINGSLVTAMGKQVQPERDEITVDGRLCSVVRQYTYLAMNKPAGYVCTHARFENEQSVFDLLPKHFHRLKIAGRLDKASEGLLVLSDDGQFVYQLTHPRYQHQKEYLVAVRRPLTSKELSKLRQGVWLAEGRACFDSIKQIGKNRYSVILHQGWKRQIRRMFETINASVLSLIRVRISKLSLKGLPSGKYKSIKKQDIQ